MKNLYIRHAIGSKLLLDCQQLQLSFEITSLQDSEEIRIDKADEDIFEVLITNRNELNIFIVDTNENGATTKKDWYYATDQPQILFDADKRTLSIIVDSKMSYPV